MELNFDFDLKDKKIHNQIENRLSSVCEKEGININNNDLKIIIKGCGLSYRKMLETIEFHYEGIIKMNLDRFPEMKIDINGNGGEFTVGGVDEKQIDFIYDKLKIQKKLAMEENILMILFLKPMKFLCLGMILMTSHICLELIQIDFI